MTSFQLHEIVDRITYRDWMLQWSDNGLTRQIRWVWSDECAVTGKVAPQHSRTWDITGMNEEQIVKTAFIALKVAIEHETMEFFKYRGRVVFDPHASLPPC